MKFLLAIFALASGLVGALEDCGGCTTPTCPPPLPEFPTCPDAGPCLVTGAGGVTACGGSATDYTCLCQCENREALLIASLVCLDTKCTAEVVATDVLPALLQFCVAVNACNDPDSKSTKRLGGSSAAERLNGSSAAV